MVPTLPGLHLPRGSGSGAATELVPGSFAWPASQDCPGIRGTSEGLCSSYPGAVPPSHTLFHYTHSGCAPTLRPLPLACLGPSRQAPSLAAAPPPAAEAPDGDSSRSAHGPQTPPRSSRRSLPPSQLLRQDWGAWRADRAPPLSPIGTEARPPSGTQELCSRRRSPAAPGEEPRGRAQGGDMLNPPILPSSPTLTSALPLRTTATPQRRGRDSR